MAATSPAKKASAKRAPRPKPTVEEVAAGLLGERSPSQDARHRTKVVFDLALGMETGPVALAPSKQTLPMTVGLVQAPSIGLPGQPNGGGMYGGANPNLAEEAATGSNGFGVRMAGRLFFTWFTQVCVNSGSNDVTQFNSGHDLCISISNFAQSGFNYKAATGVIGGAAGAYDTAINAMFTRMASLLHFNAAVTGGSTYGGFTRNKIRIDIEHEVDSNAKAGLYGSTAANAPAEFQAFWKYFVQLAEAAGIRQHLTMCLIFTTTGFDNGRVAKWFMPDSGGHVWVDEVGSDMYLGFNSSWHYAGSIPTFASANASTLKWARQWGKPFCYPEFDVCESGNDTQMEAFFADMVAQLNLITDIPCTGLWGFNQASKQEQNWNKVASEDATNHVAHAGKHSGMARLIAMGGNVIVPSAVGSAPAAPTGIAVTSAPDGKSANMVWSALPGGVDHVDVYLQAPGQTFPHLYMANVANTPRVFTFTTTPGVPTGYFATMAAAADSAGTNRSGFGAIVPFATSVQGTGNNPPVIVSGIPSPDPANPLLWNFVVLATDPDADPLAITWTLRDPSNPTAAPLVLTDSIASGGTSTLTHNFTAGGSRLYDLTVQDPSGATAEQSGTIAMALGSALTDHYQWRMLQHGESVKQMAFIDQSVKPSQDALMWTANHRRSPWNTRHRLVGSNYDPGNQSGSGVVTPVAKDFWFTTIVMEAEVIAHLRTTISQSQQGTGALGGFFDPDSGALFPDLAPFSIDTWLQNTALGMVDMDTPQAITGFSPDDKAIFGWWWPTTGITRFPSFRVRAAGGVQADIPSSGISIWGSYNNLTSFPTSIDLTAAITQAEIWLGVPEP